MSPPTILVIDDRSEIITSLQFLLEDNGYQMLFAKNPFDAKEQLSEHYIDLVLLDMNFSLDTTSGEEGLAFLAWLKKQEIDTRVVAMTAWSNVELAVKAMQLGAGDFIEKPWKNQRLLSVISQQLELKGLKAINKKLSQRLEPANDTPKFQWQSACMTELMEQIENVALADVSILLSGENGTGKSQLAEYIHQRSARNDHPLISVNMGAISESLFESEMFGHKKGAFTDAKSDRIGRFELAQSGTLFLDEIANISLAHQAKLLRVLESGQFEAVGDSKTQFANVRIISATNADCKKLIHSEKFREDLFYRLNTIEFSLPPLRARFDDIVPLAEYLLARFNKKYGKTVEGFDKSAQQLLKTYHWPGNIREMSHVIERATLLTQTTQISASGLHIGNTGSEPSLQTMMTLEQAERMLIKKALHATAHNITQAANLLGITKSSLYRRLEKYDDIEK
ncbi:sigma-54-dependent Fis family transcriptional regulator [Pseudoalteromonas phenolica]|uniref:Sigma-54-dependent Fis family transcriptional regulator n=1 Tax=Pseudoalteromonas phenolica TaxID=161398 RepID=A0A5S3YUR4_9GAMM|nr:sigma-54 dependent transcriptional regulator [Pseudoalteromonas phenolica]TMN93586.1 sigma-54-dependent Fis family transcriptional regulator [Pseudoalteromonas phenolica]TMP81469.1 sigma-54-dependent Fis family transcriptional regulator [Pseudoalteromonas phenolica]